VKIEVIPGEVRKNSGTKNSIVNPVLCKSMGRYFRNSVMATGQQHLSQQTLKLG
jgi:hypothetical protein